MTQNRPLLFAIQFPGKVNDADKAIKSLFPDSKVEIKDNSVLTLQFLKEHFSAQIQSQPADVNVLLVDIDENYNCTIQGKINTIHHFAEMADYQMQVQKDTALSNLRQATMELDIDGIMAYELTEQQFPSDLEPPPVFSTRKYPTDYNFVGQKFDKAARIRWIRIKSIDLGIPDIEIPPKLDADTFVKYKSLLSNELKIILEKTIKIFEQRPIMTSVCLGNILNIAPSDSNRNFRYVKKKILPLIAYFIPRGPYRYSYVKLGFDVRLNPNVCCHYQILDGATKKFKIKEVLENQTLNHEFNGISPCTYLNIHLRDISDPLLRSCIEEMKFKTTYSDFGGFYEDIDFAAMKLIFRRKYANLVMQEQNEIPQTLAEAKLLDIKISTKKQIKQQTDSEESIHSDDSIDPPVQDKDDFTFVYDDIVGTEQNERNHIQMEDLSKQVDAMLSNINF